MSQTPVSLLFRLRRQPDADSWKRFYELYEPFVRRCLGYDPLLANDADDLTQDVLTALVQHLPSFERKRDGSFRAWLRKVATNRVNQWWRDRKGGKRGASGSADLDSIAQSCDQMTLLWDKEHDQFILHRLLMLIRPEFSPPVWRAFERLALEDAKSADVARELNTSENAVLVSKSRVLRRLREEAEEMVD